MRARPAMAFLPVVAVATLFGCGQASLPERAGYGKDPILPPPKHSLVPVINIAPAKPWAPGETPVPAKGYAVVAFAQELDHPRTLLVLPNGDVLVAETNGPPRPENAKGVRGAVMKKVMKRAGATPPSANRITLLRDANGDGVAETRSVFIEGLNSPFGMALVGNQLYVANTDAVLRFPYVEGEMRAGGPGEKVADLPAGPLNHHWTKDLVASRDGSRLYASVGSNSNVGENGLDKEENRAAILEIDLATGRVRPFATGLRNPNGLAWQPESGALWTVVNERDEIGSDLVPDYMTSVKEGGFYGWPYSYFGAHVDERVKPPRPDLVATAIAPDYALGPHTGTLGLAFYSDTAAADGRSFGARYAGGAFIGQHGSWNRKPLIGYKVIFVPFAKGMPAGNFEDVLTGFVDKHGNARGRPVGVAVDRRTALLVADDVGNTVWRVTPETTEPKR